DEWIKPILAEVFEMKIASSNIQMQANSTYKQEYVKREQLDFWTESAPKPTATKDVVSISAEALRAQTKTVESKEEEMLTDKDYLSLKLLEEMMSVISGRKFKFNYVALKLNAAQTSDGLQLSGNASSLQNTSRAGWGMNYQYHEQFTESERMSFQANGTVQLMDGSQLNFTTSLHMSRSYSEALSLDVKAGDALKDPLVIDLDGKGISFMNKTMQFDLDLDGSKDDIPILSKGNGYLVLDRNNNGILDDGSELFGPKTDHGFDELAAYDQDQNGWIDENDDIFKSLKIWASEGNGEGQLIGIANADVGAIYLGNVKSSFQFKDTANHLMGQLKQTGVYLKESGSTGIIQEVDLRV
ncbi:MAG: hypothetical protein PHU31_09995, partial [Anaerotignum sp.]|nr:hypothetical protein [Anaerotignum sp.]